MNRIDSRLQILHAEGRKALVTYIVNGDPYPQATLPTMHALVAAGVDIIELGVPFSDPMAEGPTIQRGHERALKHNVSLADTLNLVRQFRSTNDNTPVVLMGYTNPVERMGYEQFAIQAAQAGVDGLLTVDLPPEEAEDLAKHFSKVGLHNIFLLAPTTKTERAQSVVNLASGFLYYVSLKGVTGAGHLDTTSVANNIARIRSLTDMPIFVGFGIKDGESAKAVSQHADGAVIGSVLVNQMGELESAEPDEIANAIADTVKPIRNALDQLN